MNNKSLSVLGLIIFAALLRLLPHPWNFSPIAAIALFGGAQFRTRSAAFLIPLSALLLSDLFIGFYPSMHGTYLSFAAVVLLGRFFLNEQSSAPKILATSIAGSITFFLLSNFGVWLWDNMYLHTIQGLVQCYAAALPFFQGTLAGDVVYTTLLFGAFHLAQSRFPSLQQASSI